MDLQQQVKELIISTLNLEGMNPDEIETEAPLFGEGLGLDSIDALELGMAIKNTFGLKLSADNEEMRKHFYSVQTICDFIRQSQED